MRSGVKRYPRPARPLNGRQYDYHRRVRDRTVENPEFYTRSNSVNSRYGFKTERTEYVGTSSLPTKSVLLDQIDANTVSISSNSFTGQTNPSWKSEIFRGVSATTPAFGTRRTFEQVFLSAQAFWDNLLPSTSHRTDFDESWGHTPVDMPTIGTPTQSQITEAENRAIRRFIEKAESVRGSVESGQDFGEYHQTVESFMRPCNSLREHTLSYFPSLMKVKHKYRDAISLRKALADTYLEWTYGWNPLISDIAQAYVDLNNKGFDLYPISSGGHVTYNGLSDLSTINTGSGLFTIDVVRKTVSTYQVRLKGSIKSGRVNGSLPVLQEAQLDAAHFLPTAWDLLPYSFIADYFINIGDIIKSACFVQSALAWGVKTTRNITERECSYRLRLTQSTGKYDRCVLHAPNSKASVTSFTRGAIGDGDLIERVEIHLPYSAKPFLNMSALLLSRAKPLAPFF
jgi:predicted HAD superfamily Cof-like phosphohydrolase